MEFTPHEEGPFSEGDLELESYFKFVSIVRREKVMCMSFLSSSEDWVRGVM